MWWKYIYWKQGIPAYQFKQETIQDIHDIIDIDIAMNQKLKRTSKINQMIANVSMGK